MQFTVVKTATERGTEKEMEAACLCAHDQRRRQARPAEETEATRQCEHDQRRQRLHASVSTTSGDRGYTLVYV